MSNYPTNPHEKAAEISENIESALNGFRKHHRPIAVVGVVQWFNTMTTNEYIRNVKANNWTRFNGKLWQWNYREHIIRHKKSHSKLQITLPTIRVVEISIVYILQVKNRETI